MNLRNGLNLYIFGKTMHLKNEGLNMKKNIHEWLDDYGESHKNQLNKKIHWICVPLITITLLGLLSLIKYSFTVENGTYNINIAGLFIIFAILFYFKLSKSLAIGMLFLTGICMNYIQKLEMIYSNDSLLLIYIVVFVIAWIGQFIGHKIEGKKPSFLKDVQFLLIGPVWLLSFIYKKLNIKI